MALTDAQLVDARRFCGYAVPAAVAVCGDATVIANSQLLDIILSGLTSTQERVVSTLYLANLTTLEAAIVSASANLDTAKAAVWTHNQDELADRQALYYAVRLQFAAFLGVPPGPGAYAPTTNAGPSGATALPPGILVA